MNKLLQTRKYSTTKLRLCVLPNTYDAKFKTEQSVKSYNKKSSQHYHKFGTNRRLRYRRVTCDNSIVVSNCGKTVCNTSWKWVARRSKKDSRWWGNDEEEMMRKCWPLLRERERESRMKWWRVEVLWDWCGTLRDVVKLRRIFYWCIFWKKHLEGVFEDSIGVSCWENRLEWFLETSSWNE